MEVKSVWELTVLRQICGVTRKDRRSVLHLWEELSIEKDIVEVLQTRGLAYFVRVNRTRNDTLPELLLCNYVCGWGGQEVDQTKRDGQTMSIKTVKTWIYLYTTQSHFAIDRTKWRSMFITWDAKALSHLDGLVVKLLDSHMSDFGSDSVVSIGAMDYQERLVSIVTCYVSSGILISTHSFESSW